MKIGLEQDPLIPYGAQVGFRFEQPLVAGSLALGRIGRHRGTVYADVAGPETPGRLGKQPNLDEQFFSCDHCIRALLDAKWLIFDRMLASGSKQDLP
jgi:hypothetical protein